MIDRGPIEAVTLDFFNTLVFHREGRGRGRLLIEYLEEQGFAPAPWEHDVLYDVFESHDDAYSPVAPQRERDEYCTELASRLFERMGIRASSEDALRHAEALWQILGPACFEVFPEAPDTLEELRAEGLPLAVISNWQCGLRHFCEELGISDFFEHILGSADLGVAKPDERIFREASRRLGVTPDRTLHVGDTFVDDYVGGESAGVQVVLIDRRTGADSPAARVIRSLVELPRLVRENHGQR